MGGASVGIEGSVQAWASVFNLGNCAIGAGILTFPFVFQCSGLLGGVLLCLLVSNIELFTLKLLSRQATKHKAVSYQGLVLRGLGPAYAEVMSWTILMFLFGSCVAYLIIVGDTFGAVLTEYVITPLGMPAWLATRQLMIVLPATTIILPLALQRSMGALAPTSTLAVIAMTITTAVIVAKCAAAAAAGALAPVGVLLPDGVVLFKFDLGTIAAIPVIAFAYHCHVQSIPILYELTDDPRLTSCGRRRPVAPDAAASPLAPVARAQRKLAGMSRVLATAYAECTVMYLAVGMTGYLLFPRDTSSNILNSFSRTEPLMQLVRFLVGWAVVFHYPINLHVARSATYDLICRYLGLAPRVHAPYAHVAAITLGFFAATTVTACVVTDLGIVFQVLGGVAGALMIFVLPGALLLRGAAPAPDDASPRGAASAGECGTQGAALAEPLLAAVRVCDGRGAGAAPALESPCTVRSHCEGSWDTRATGAVLVALGVLLAGLTLYSTIGQFLREHLMGEGAPGEGLLLSGQLQDEPREVSFWTQAVAA